jgi:hypothetical protein
MNRIRIPQVEMGRRRDLLGIPRRPNRSHKSHDHGDRWETARRAAASPPAEDVSEVRKDLQNLRSMWRRRRMGRLWDFES